MKLALAADRCSGCRACELVCALENFQALNPKKAALRVTGQFPAPGRYAVAYCDQCGTCAEVCPTNAIQQGADGTYIISAEDCIGCGICVDECPKQVMYRHDDHGYVPIKCTLCGKCLTYCPTGALYDADGVIQPRR
jgi:Fe-S-cluster-containing hydrogenase component 2